MSQADKSEPRYKTVCISMYRDDVEAIEDTVNALKQKGFSAVNRSMLIRAAVSRLDPNQLELCPGCMVEIEAVESPCVRCGYTP